MPEKIAGVGEVTRRKGDVNYNLGLKQKWWKLIRRGENMPKKSPKLVDVSCE